MCLCAGIYFSPHTQGKLRLWNEGEGYHSDVNQLSGRPHVMQNMFEPLNLCLLIRAQSLGQDPCTRSRHGLRRESSLDQVTG